MKNIRTVAVNIKNIYGVWAKEYLEGLLLAPVNYYTILHDDKMNKISE